VVKNILALGRIAVTLDDYHGPTLGVAKGRVWEQPSASVGSRKDLPTGAVGSSKHLLVVGSEKEGATRSSRASAAALSEEEELARTLDVGSLDETGAALLWLSAVLEEDLQGQSLQQCLLSGVRLCKLINAIMPEMIARVNVGERPWGHMENIGNYTKACTLLGVTPVFETPDLYEGKNLKCVAQNLVAVARYARTCVGYVGPLIAAQTATMNT